MLMNAITFRVADAPTVLPPPRYTHVHSLTLLAAEAQEAAFPSAPLHAANACRHGN